MDFQKILTVLTRKFEEKQIRFALIGGFALGLWGVGRSTIDIDFLVEKKIEDINSIMTDMGYRIHYQTENVSQFISEIPLFGEVDFLHAFRPLSLQMLDRVEKKSVFGGKLKVPVLRPEDLIGLKLQALKNDPTREAVDLQDIKALMGKDNSYALDKKLVFNYFKIFQLQDLFVQLEKENL